MSDNWQPPTPNIEGDIEVVVEAAEHVEQLILSDDTNRVLRQSDVPREWASVSDRLDAETIKLLRGYL